MTIWCKSHRVPITQGPYTLADGTPVLVVQAASGRFYATAGGRYVPGLIYRLRAELEAGQDTTQGLGR